MVEAVKRPWGEYVTVHCGAGFLVKEIRVRPGQRLSLQSHEHRSESWVVVQGTAHVTRGGDPEQLVGARGHVFIPRQVRHRIRNASDTEDLVFVEVQHGETLAEEDIVRYDDDYGRGAAP